MFVVQNFQGREFDTVEGEEEQFAPYEMEIKTSKFDLSLFAFEAGDEISFYLEYSTALFKRATIEKMAERFIEIIKQVVDNKNIILKDITMSHQLTAIQSDNIFEDGEDFGF